MKKPSLSAISIILSLANIAMIIKINHDIAIRYLSSDGKTKALFGIIELQFNYKYYFILIGLLSLSLAILAIRKKGNILITQIATILGILSTALIFVRLWRLMI